MRKTNDYGRELGAGIKEGMKGLNTAASPKKKKTCYQRSNKKETDSKCINQPLFELSNIKLTCTT